MYRLILSMCIAATFAITTQAAGQQPGAFLLAGPKPANEAMPLVPQSTEVKEKNPWIAFL